MNCGVGMRPWTRSPGRAEYTEGPAVIPVKADGKFTWQEVECLGACANAPMAQIGKDYYEDLTAAKLRDLIARFSKGEVPVPGPQNGRYAAEPLSGLTSLKEFESGKKQYNASAQLAVDIGDTVKRIDGTEVPILTPWLGKTAKRAAKVSRLARKALIFFSWWMPIAAAVSGILYL